MSGAVTVQDGGRDGQQSKDAAQRVNLIPANMTAFRPDADGKLVQQTVPTPTPGPGEVLVEIMAAGVNPVDLKARKDGILYSTGVDGAGVVVPVGENVPEHMRGKRYVFHASLLKMREGHPEYGSFAQYAVVPKDALIEIPADMPYEDAVALVCPGGTAQQIAEALEQNLENFQRENPKTKPAVFVQSASGAVGQLAVQLLKLKYPNLVVIGSASEGKHKDLHGLGVTPVTYGEGELERVNAAVENAGAKLVGIVDMQGKEGVQKHYDALSGVTHATLVCVLNKPTAITESGPTVQQIALGMAYDIQSGRKTDIPAYRDSKNPVKKMAEDIEKVLMLVAEGKIKGPDIERMTPADLMNLTIETVKGKPVVSMIGLGTPPSPTPDRSPRHDRSGSLPAIPRDGGSPPRSDRRAPDTWSQRFDAKIAAQNNMSYETLFPDMEYRSVGLNPERSLKLSRLVLGTDHLGKIPAEQRDEVLELAVALGINAFDTAPIYVGGIEYELGNWLRRSQRPDLVTISKGGFPLDTAPGTYTSRLAGDVNEITAHIREELGHITSNLPWVDILLMHRDDFDAELYSISQRTQTPPDVILRALRELDQNFLMTGVSNWTTERVNDAQRAAKNNPDVTQARPVMSSPYFSLFEMRGGNDTIHVGGQQVTHAQMMDTSFQKGVTIMPYSPLGGFGGNGIPRLGWQEAKQQALVLKIKKDRYWGHIHDAIFTPDNEARWNRAVEFTKRFNDTHKTTYTVDQTLNAYVLAHPRTDLLAVGPRTPEQLRRTVGALKLSKLLTPEDLEFMHSGKRSKRNAA